MREYKSQEFTYEEIVDAFHRTPDPHRHFGTECTVAVRGDQRYIVKEDWDSSIRTSTVSNRVIDFVKRPHLLNQASAFGWTIKTHETWVSE